MGPITKKVNQLLSTEGLSDETIQILNELKSYTQNTERQLINDSYHNGYTDKEMKRRPIWDHFEYKYGNAISKMDFFKSK